jgi:hypothetical protein
MADTVLRLEAGTPHQIAYELLHDIAIIEGKNLASDQGGATREWILNTYAECLKVARTTIVVTN